MAASEPQDTSKPPSQSSAPLFDPFPEPQGFPIKWDGTVLEALSRPKSSGAKSKPLRS